MAKNKRATTGTEGVRRDPSAPKGRPTPGRKQRNAEARARERRHRRVVRLWWAGLIVLVLGLIALAVVTSGDTTGGLPLG